MSVLTGANGSLRYRGSLCARVRDWTLTINRDALETTCIGGEDRSYTKGLRGASGSSTILYDPNDQNSRDLLNSILDNKKSDDVEFIFNNGTNERFHCTAFLTSVNQSVTVGEAQAMSVSFQVSGPVSGAY